MCYTAVPITERIKRVKECYLRSPVAQEINPYVDKKYKKFCTGDRWMTLGYLRGWQKHADAETTRLRTSYAEAEELYEAQPVIFEDELLAGHLYLPVYTPEEQAEYDRLCDMFQMSPHTLVERPPRRDHLSLDFDKLLRLGIRGIMDEIRTQMAQLNFGDRDVYPGYDMVIRYEFYRCCLIELEAVLDLADRYSKKARELALSAAEPRKSELLRMSKILEAVPAGPANSFYEAIQSVQFFLSGLFGLYPLNRPDRYLYAYYKKDIESGAVTREEAQELIDNFCLHVSTRVFSRAACGFIVGGQDSNGALVENDLTYMFLTALEHLRLPDPNGALAVNEKTGEDILKYCAEILSKGVTHPAFYNDNAIIASLEKNYGCTHEDAVNYIHTTCAEITVVGKTRGYTTPICIELPRILQETTKENPDCMDFDTLMERYLAKIREFLRRKSLRYFIRMLEASRIGNEPMRVCALIDNCIQRGRSIYEGGEKYTFFQPIFIGFATAVDSLLAVRTVVFQEKRFTLEAFQTIVEKNYDGEESFRQYLLNRIPHYGNDEAESDALAAELASRLLSIFKDQDLLGGSIMMPGTFSYISHATCGGEMGATFDGRLAGCSYSDGCSPVQGRDVNGPTAMILSLTSWEQSALLGGMVVNIKFGAENLKGEKQDNFLQLLHTFIQRGGLELQVNVVDRKTLEDARKHPENHQNLLVRIGGFSDYFTRLTPVLQQEIIARTEY